MTERVGAEMFVYALSAEERGRAWFEKGGGLYSPLATLPDCMILGVVSDLPLCPLPDCSCATPRRDEG